MKDERGERKERRVRVLCRARSIFDNLYFLSLHKRERESRPEDNKT